MSDSQDTFRKKAENILNNLYKSRSIKLDALIAKYGSPKELSAAIGKSRSYITTLLCRDIGENAARTIEDALEIRGYFELPDISQQHVMLMSSPYRTNLVGLNGRGLEQAFYRMRLNDLVEEYQSALELGNQLGFYNGHYISLMRGSYRSVSEMTRILIEQLPGRKLWFSPQSVYESRATISV